MNSSLQERLRAIYVQLDNAQTKPEQRRLLRAAGEILDQLKIIPLSTRSYVEYWESVSIEDAIDDFSSVLFVGTYLREGAYGTWWPVDTNVLPPTAAEFVLHLFLPKQDRQVMIGDLIEEYKLMFSRFGKPCADFWFCTQVIRSVWPLLKRAALRLLLALLWFQR
jgi:hypothetical protein